MEKTLGKEYGNQSQRIAFLQDNCDAVEETGYMKRYTPEQIQAMKEDLAETSISINDLETEKKEIVKEFKEKTDPLREHRSTLLKGIKEKAIFTKEKCFKFVDQEAKMTGFYNSEGDLVELRPANSDELQGTIFQMQRKTGTNN